MQKLIRKLMFIGAWIFFFELLILAGLFAYLSIDGSALAELFIAVAALFITFDIYYVFVSLKLLSDARRKNDLSATEIIGDDIQEVYSYAQVGLVIIDNENFVIWVNERFDFLNQRIIDKDIYTWQPGLMAIKDGDEETKVTIDNRIYQVKHIKDANLFIFKDVTEYESVVNFSYQHTPVVGLVSIDNYQDVVSLTDEVTSNDLISSVQKTIINYFSKYDVLLKKYRADGYLIVTNREKFDLMLKEKFALVEEIREEIRGTEYDPTLSIGFAYGIHDMKRLHDLATSALDVALARGGDQVVVSPFGESMQYYGGKSEAKTKRNRVRARVLSQSLQAQILESNEVFVMGHKDADLDAIGSALGIYEFAKQCGKPVYIVYDERLCEAKAKNAFKSQFSREEIKSMTISPKAASEIITDDTLLIITDVSKPSFTMSPKLCEDANKIAIIDHHRRGEDFPDRPVLVHIEPAASSSSELVAELIKYNDNQKTLTSRVATIMLSGIFLDTNYYRNKTGPRTYDASTILKEFGADNLLADEFMKEDYEEYSLKVSIVSNAFTPYTGVVVCKADEDEIIDRTMLAICAQEMLSIKGINAAFVIGKIDAKTTAISARSDGSINVQLLMEKMGGGGHFAASATQIENRSIEEVSTSLKITLDLYLNEARTDELKN